MNKIAQLDRRRRAEIFAETSNRLALPEALVEKDFWVCWLLAQIFSIEPLAGALLFKGGTSLSKVFGLIQRFSEDIDLAVDYTVLGFTGSRDPVTPGLSRTKQLTLMSEMLEACQRFINGPFLEHLDQRITEVLGPAGRWALTVDEHDPNIVRFRYPTAIQTRLAYIPPQVILELGTHAEFVPRGEFTIRSFAAAEFPQLFEQSDIRLTSLLAKRTFWEKATILHAEFHRPAHKPTPARYSRHYYDIAMMGVTAVKNEAFQDLDLLRAVVRHKQTFYPAAWAQYPLALPGTFRFVPNLERVSALRRDYREMQVMIFGESPSFERVLEILGELERELNSHRAR